MNRSELIQRGWHERSIYATDASMYREVPSGIATPRDGEELRRIVVESATRNEPILARGAGTSLAGQTVGSGLVLDFSKHMHRILSMDPAQKMAFVQPGVVLDQLNQSAQEHGLRFGPDVSTSTHATLGGMIANRSAGSYSLKYGMTDEHIVALNCILADGTRVKFAKNAAMQDPLVMQLTEQVARIVLSVQDEIDRRFPDIRRNVSGYALDDILAQLRSSSPGTYDQVNLSQLICGSEGTLALIESAQLRLVKTPQNSQLLVVSFSTVDEACKELVSLVQTYPAAVELIDANVIQSAKDQGGFSGILDKLPNEGALVYLEYHDEDTQVAEKLLSDHGISYHKPSDFEEAKTFWRLRKEGLGLIGRPSEGRMPIAGFEDCAIPLKQYASFRREFADRLAKDSRDAVWYAHASVGLLHVRPRFDLRKESEQVAWHDLTNDLTRLVIKHGGTVSGEHGDGRIRAKMVHDMLGPTIVEAIRQIKILFDPKQRLNPGNIVEARPALVPLRIDGRHQPITEPDTETFWKWPEGLAQTAGSCNGNGLCRKETGGAMCPSWRATRDERHATRGRGNALREAITGADQPDFSDPDLHSTLELCLSCKACRHECPANFDVSKFKSEVLAQHHHRNGTPIRARLFGSIRPLAKLGSRFHRLANLIQNTPPVRYFTNHWLGLAPGRSLPKFSKSLFSRWKPNHAPNAPTVILMADCFSCFYESDLGLAAIKVLESFGYQVVLEDVGCCGRTNISVGRLDAARKNIERTAPAIEGLRQKHDAIAILALEPSCASAMQEDWGELKTNVPTTTTANVAKHTASLESFLLNHWDQHPIRPNFKANDQSVVVHTHCHAKHQGPVAARLLENVGFKATAIDSGCCGLAGSFGYRAECDDVSRNVAEQSLGHHLQEHPNTLVVAHGTSCRHQVEDVFGRETASPIVLLANALV
ncbi:MAG: hypothetical protein CMJ28_03650 [Phycisphaerae bacterium]|nr:hypothetical protein [Phycisphaerae bacterium]